MKMLDPLPPAPENAPSERTSPAAVSSHAHERFDAIMGRVLARSSQDSNDDSCADEPSPEDRQPAQSRKTESTNAPAAGASGCVDPGAATLPSARASTPENPPPGVAPLAQGQANAPTSETSIPTNAKAANANATTEISSLADELSLTGNNSATPSTDPAAASTALADASGISGAKYPMAMQKAENADNFSGSTEQNLPADAAINGADEGIIHSVDSKSHHDKPEVSTVSATALSASSSTEATTAAIAAEWPAPARSMERTHEMMSLQALRLRESGQDSLQVVIKPDAGLQLSLNLQMRDGNVEMRALLHRGNFEFLNLHWPELQQQLESRGVRLGPLEYGDAAADGQGGTFQSADQQTPDEPASASGAFAEFALNSTLVPKPAPGSGSIRARGWESWA